MYYTYAYTCIKYIRTCKMPEDRRRRLLLVSNYEINYSIQSVSWKYDNLKLKSRSNNMPLCQIYVIHSVYLWKTHHRMHQMYYDSCRSVTVS